MKFRESWALFLLLIIITGVVMTSGCGSSAVGRPSKENEENNSNESQSINNTPNQQNNQKSNQDVQTTTKKSTENTQTPTSIENPTSTTPSKPASCSHPSTTTKYIDMDKATGKIIYEVYCTKCGKSFGRVLY